MTARYGPVYETGPYRWFHDDGGRFLPRHRGQPIVEGDEEWTIEVRASLD